MFKTLAVLATFLIAGFASTVPSTCVAQAGQRGDNLVGAWQGKLQFTSGAFAENQGSRVYVRLQRRGTMTESSNYDAAPPVPPAYGAWKKVGLRKYEAKYHFFQSKPVTTADELIKGGGWAPDGYGILAQKMTLSADGKSFDSRIALELFDKNESLQQAEAKVPPRGKGSRTECSIAMREIGRIWVAMRSSSSWRC